MSKNPILVVAAVILLVASSVAADQNTTFSEGNKNELRVSSDSLGAMVLDKKIKLMMRDGTYVEGDVVQATRDAITLKVKKSEPRNRFQGKEATIPTSDIGAVYLRKGGSVAAPIALGIGCGFLGGIVAGLALRDSQGTAGPALIGIGSITGGAIGGALLGREAVKKTVTINVLQPSEP
jgi:hypothetical protein